MAISEPPDTPRQYSFDEGPPQPVLLDATSLKPSPHCINLSNCGRDVSGTGCRRARFSKSGLNEEPVDRSHGAPMPAAAGTCLSGSGNYFCSGVAGLRRA